VQFVDLQRQYRLYKEEIDAAIHAVLDGSRYIMGAEVGQLEEKLAAFVDARHCVTVGSGTEALQVAMMALGIGPGDEVITVPFTWISTAEAICLVGAKPVFVDVCPDTYNLDIDQLEGAITERTRAIMPVSLFGQMPNFERINAIAKHHGISVIEDGAQSFGAEQGDQKSCGVTEVSATSFFPAKPFGCYGDGGATFTNDDELAARMRAIRTHGGERRHHHPYLGMNSRFDTIQAAVLLAKWPHFASEIVRRQELAARYTEALGACCITPLIQEGNTHIFAQYTLRFEDRDAVAERLTRRDIPSMVYYPRCLHEQPVFADLGYSKGSFPVAEKAADEVLSLPLHPWMTDEEQARVIEVVLEVARLVAVC
jgi:UDP-2-acetamido-2-deoxy-ribo-hexuluronate aminotransferase